DCNWGGGDRPAEGYSFWTIVHSVVCSLRWSCRCTVYQVQDVTVVVVLLIVTLQGSVSEAEVLSLLLSNGNTRESIREVASDWNHHRTIALGEFVWVGVSLNGCCKFLSRSQVEVFDVVSPDWSWLRTRWLLGNSGKTIPCGR